MVRKEESLSMKKRIQDISQGMLPCVARLTTAVSPVNARAPSQILSSQLLADAFPHRLLLDQLQPLQLEAKA